MQMLNFDEVAINLLRDLPETGMGFQLIQAILWGEEKLLLVLNSERAIDLSQIGLEPGNDPSTILRNGMRIIDVMRDDVVLTTFSSPQPHSFRLLSSRISAAHTVPGHPTAAGLRVAPPSSLIKHVTLTANRVFHRYSAFNPDRRVDSKTGSLPPGTYAAPASEIPFVPTGFVAVGRFALPNNLRVSVVKNDFRERGGVEGHALRRMESLLIQHGHVIDPANGIDHKMDVLLRDGRVAAVAPPGKLRGQAKQTFNARGCIVAPGLIDLHVHLREPGQSHKETIATGTAAAAAGGFTSVCVMPNTLPVKDSPEIVRWMLSPERGALVNVFPIAAATVGSMGEKLTNFAALKRAGAVAFTDDGKPILDDRVMRDALKHAARLKLPIVQHAEDTRVTTGCSMNYGPTSFRLGVHGMPNSAEASVVERDIALARETGGHLHVAHLSTREALAAVRAAKQQKLRVSTEVTPHHFTLIDENVGEFDTHYKMNPPLRSAADRDALIEGIVDGTIDAIATDHAPHAFHEKAVEFERAAFGITGLETSLAIALTVLHHHFKLPLGRIVELMSTNPAKLFGLKGRGTLAEGSHADVTIFDPRKDWTFEASQSLSKSRNTPFNGWSFTGRAVATIIGGKMVYEG